MTDPDRLVEGEGWARWAAVHDDRDKTRDLMYILLDAYDSRGAALAAARERIAELEKDTADCGICKLGGRVLYINDHCPEHGDHETTEEN